MQAGELWWAGKEETLSAKLDKMAPSCLSLEQVFLASLKKAPTREHAVFDPTPLKRDDIEERMILFSQWKMSMEATIASVESTQRAQAAIDNLRKTLNEFRGAIKNDLSSMKAASERVQNEVLQMHDKYRKAQDILTTPDFMKAIENAERMAAALEAIQKLTETKVSVAVFGGGK